MVAGSQGMIALGQVKQPMKCVQSSPLLDPGALAQEPVQFVGHALLELLNLLRLVAPEAAPELLGADITGCQVERVIAHRGRSPNSRVPNRTMVAPSSTATW